MTANYNLGGVGNTRRKLPLRSYSRATIRVRMIGSHGLVKQSIKKGTVIIIGDQLTEDRTCTGGRYLFAGTFLLRVHIDGSSCSAAARISLMVIGEDGST